MAQITESQLFEMLGRLWAEVRALQAQNGALLAQLEEKTQKKKTD